MKTLFFATVLSLLLLTGCAHLVPLEPDGKWHAVYAIQVPDKQVQIDVERVRSNYSTRRATLPSRRTEIRVLQIESFQRLDCLPETIEQATPREDSIPIKLADSGPYDMTLPGARRILSLITGKQLLARTWDPNASLKLHFQEHTTSIKPK